MNVCLRGSSSGSMALWKRCAGNRRALSHSYKAGEVGFRLNGVWRGGRRGSSYQNRASIRNWQGEVPLSRVHGDVGFR